MMEWKGTTALTACQSSHLLAHQSLLRYLPGSAAAANPSFNASTLSSYFGINQFAIWQASTGHTFCNSLIHFNGGAIRDLLLQPRYKFIGTTAGNIFVGIACIRNVFIC